MKSIYNTNWFIFIRGLLYNNGVNLTFAVAIKHMFFFIKLGEGSTHNLCYLLFQYYWLGHYM